MSFLTPGTIALVTGANRGIGRALVDALLARGATRVYAGARRLDTLVELVASSGGRVVPVQLDVTHPDEVRAAAAQASDVTLLVNNAGVVAKFGAPFTDDGWLDAARTEYEVNVHRAVRRDPGIRADPGEEWRRHRGQRQLRRRPRRLRHPDVVQRLEGGAALPRRRRRARR